MHPAKRKAKAIGKAIGIAVFGAIAVTGAAHGAGGDSVATAAPLKTPPTIDGKIADGEWDDAVRTSLFTRWRRLEFEPRYAAAWMGFDEKNLYIAVQSELRPTGLIAEKKFDDGQLVFDSCIEIWIDPNRDNRARGKGDLSYYQFIGNSIGTKKDVKFSLGAGTSVAACGDADVLSESVGSPI